MKTILWLPYWQLPFCERLKRLRGKIYLVHVAHLVEPGQHCVVESWTVVLFQQSIAEGELVNWFDTWSVTEIIKSEILRFIRSLYQWPEQRIARSTSRSSLPISKTKCDTDTYKYITHASPIRSSNRSLDPSWLNTKTMTASFSKRSRSSWMPTWNLQLSPVPPDYLLSQVLTIHSPL